MPIRLSTGAAPAYLRRRGKPATLAGLACVAPRRYHAPFARVTSVSGLVCDRARPRFPARLRGRRVPADTCASSARRLPAFRARHPCKRIHLSRDSASSRSSVSVARLRSPAVVCGSQILSPTSMSNPCPMATRLRSLPPRVMLFHGVPSLRVVVCRRMCDV